GQPVADPGGLGRLVGRLDEFNIWSGRLLRLESDGLEAVSVWLPNRSCCHDRIGASHHLGRRPVVAYEPDHRGVGKTLTETGEVAGLGSGKGVDGLRRITDHAQLSPFTTPQVQQRLLQWADVL